MRTIGVLFKIFAVALQTKFQKYFTGGLPKDNPKIRFVDRVVDSFLRVFLSSSDILKQISFKESLYLRRYFLKKGDGGPGDFIHFFARSDDDRHPHNHPLPFKVFIFNRGYYEEDVNGVEHFRSPRRWRSQSADWFHRVHLTEGPVWTYFKHGPREQDWGFLTEDGWVRHDEYTKYTGARRR